MTSPSQSRKDPRRQPSRDPLRLLHLLQAGTGPPPGSGPARILVVDDDERFRQSLIAMLEMVGYCCLAAAGGPEAVRLLEEQAPDLVLLDLLMPGMDGHQVLDRLRSRDGDVGIIIISVDSRWDSVRRTLRRGADNFIRKPYAPDEVLAAIESSLQKRELRRQN
ncbi:MAG TPA: response regulator, partial [Desulfobulbus sp.]|nr:response regulator [Desulfobulbus sp.]